MSAPHCTHAYIGMDAEGHVRAIIFDDLGYQQDTQKVVSEWLAMGRAVVRLPKQEACARMAADWDKP